MASSPTSSSYSSYSSAFGPSSPEFTGLPVMAMRKKIVEKIQENRITLIVGEAGCGKSSQVPQFLLEENMDPILCTQPRRFAVVAVARMVAKARNCEIGGEVGYHIGHSKVISSRSKIVFKTAGVLLEEMREKGSHALKYKVIILDEVHERSVESDLVLVCVKQFLLRNNDLRLVLMSATADIARYRDYFRDLGRGERIEVLAIPSTGQHTIFQRKVFYLEQVTKLLGVRSENLSLDYCSGPSPFMAKADFKPEVHKLIHDLVIHIHKNEEDMEKSILVFLPTYYALEQQWVLLKPFSSSFKIQILHSSIETNQALKAMKICKSHRKVILATNIAESSVTIPKVGYVIDSCRSLQVFWDTNRKTDSVEFVWVSKSQAEQRRGRTGRTCDGHVYRLVTRSFYNLLEQYEPPAILRLSLRQQVLHICCTESKAINDPKVLLQKAMDPPGPEVVEDALGLLVHIRALERASSRGRHEPSFYGRLLASFSLSFDASVLILKFGDIGMLREGILLGILMDLQPLPIIRPFGQDALFMQYVDNFHSELNLNTGLGKKEMICMANLCAFMFWQRTLKNSCGLEQLKQIFNFNETEETKTLLPNFEEEWCLSHNLIRSALDQVAETYDEILNSLHRFRPKSLVVCDGLPSYYSPRDFQHTCQLKYEGGEDIEGVALDVHQEHENNLRRCTAVPFVGPNDFHLTEVAVKLASIVKEMRIQDAEDASQHQPRFHHGHRGHAAGEPSMCKFFLNGLCNRGSQCLFSHSLEAKPPVCKFFFSLQGCRNGDSCSFSHDVITTDVLGSKPSLCLPEDDVTNPESLMRLFPSPRDGSVLLLDDRDLHFSSHLAQHFDPSHIITTTSEEQPSSLDPSIPDIKILWGLMHPFQTIVGGGENTVPWYEVKCILWFPLFDGEYGEGQKSLLQTFFEYLAIRMLSDALHGVRVILTINNLRFSQLQVEKLARDRFFFLRESLPFDESSFGELQDEITTKKPMVISKPFSYVFNLCPPSEVQFGDYATAIRRRLQHQGYLH